MKKALLTILVLLSIGSTVLARPVPAPAWFQHDIARHARWLPPNIKSLGIDKAYQQRFAQLPPQIQTVLRELNIPPWLVALIPTDSSIQDEINKQLSGLTLLAGPAPQGPLAQRAEQLLLFGGAAQLPTPGDAVTGLSLGAEGCTAAMSRYILSQLKLEFPDRMPGLNEDLATTQSSVEMKKLFLRLAAQGARWFDIQDYPFSQLRAQDIQPGSLMIAQKPGGTHTFAWTRVFGFWNWTPTDKMAIGNTGLPQFGSRMILAQEYITEDAGEALHNEHGPINSLQVIKKNGQIDLSDPRTNVYAAEGSDFIVINLH
ncbi:MAG: hypothetical protein ACXWQQ_12215 [Pseudobdellovibrio sp.]